MGRLGERDPEAGGRAGPGLRRGRSTSSWPASGPTSRPPTSRTTTSWREQLAAFGPVAERVRELAPGCIVHAANSAATLREPASHFDMVRCGIAIYGLDPFGADPADQGLRPALELRSYVADVKRFEAGASAGYGRTWRAPADTWVGVLPIGYGDGVRRALSNNGEVLVRGRRHPIVGTVSMDNLTIDLGPRDRRRAGRRGGADRRSRDRSASSPRSWRAGWRRSTTRSPPASRPGCRAPTGSERRRDPGAAPGGGRLGRSPRARPSRTPSRPGSSAGRCATRSSPRPSATRTSPCRPGTEKDAARAIARGAGGVAFPLSERHATWRAHGRAGGRRRVARRRDRAARRDDRGGPRRARLHRQRGRGPAARRRADRPHRRAGRRRGPHGCGRSARPPSPRTRCGCCGRRGSRPLTRSRSRTARCAWPAHRPGWRPRRPASASSPSCAGCSAGRRRCARWSCWTSSS